MLVAPVRDNRLDPVLAALRDMDIQELPFAADTAVRLAGLRAATGLTMSDCCVLLAAEDADGELACFDEKLAQAAEKQKVPVLGR